MHLCLVGFARCELSAVGPLVRPSGGTSAPLPARMHSVIELLLLGGALACCVSCEDLSFVALPLRNTVGIMGGVAHAGPAPVDVMKAFSAANKAPDGRGRCFKFWRQGVCDRGDRCPFAHV